MAQFGTRGAESFHEVTAGSITERAPVDDTRRLPDTLGWTERRGHPAYLAQRLLEIALSGVADAEPLVPGAQAP
jgi:hypothetical protein